MSEPQAIRHVFVAAGDTQDATEVRECVREVVPPGWALSDQPDGATVIVAVDLDVDAAMIERAGPGLRAVVTTGPEVAEAGEVRVVTMPDESAMSRRTVAEFVVTLILMLVHNMLAVARRTNAAAWAPDRSTPILTDQHTYTYNWPAVPNSGLLFGRSVGIVGAGTIGAHLARMLAPFGVRLLYTQRNRMDAAAEQRMGLEWREFDDLLRESDILALCHRLQEGPGGNENQFGAREFALMKPNAFLINVARGRVIDEDAMVAALRNGVIAGVGLDVFRYEPLPTDHPLLEIAGDNVILTPHIAAGTENEYWRCVVNAAVHACADR